MPEPSSAGALALTTAGLSVFGVATGLHPELLLAGLAGGLWALSYQPPMPLLRRMATAAMSAVIAAWGTPPAVAVVLSLGLLPVTATGELLRFPVALGIGLLSYTVIGPGLLARARKNFEGAA